MKLAARGPAFTGEADGSNRPVGQIPDAPRAPERLPGAGRAERGHDPQLDAIWTSSRSFEPAFGRSARRTARPGGPPRPGAPPSCPPTADGPAPPERPE